MMYDSNHTKCDSNHEFSWNLGFGSATFESNQRRVGFEL